MRSFVRESPFVAQVPFAISRKTNAFFILYNFFLEVFGYVQIHNFTTRSGLGQWPEKGRKSKNKENIQKTIRQEKKRSETKDGKYMEILKKYC